MKKRRNNFSLYTKMEQKSLQERINSLIQALESEYRSKYDVPIFEIVGFYDPADNAIILRGTVLLFSQLQRLREVFQSQLPLKIVEDIVVLQDPNLEFPGLLWGKPMGKIVDVWRGTKKDERVTQILAEDPPFKILWETEKRVLVQLDDLTLGWVDKSDVNILKGSHLETWISFHRTQPETVIYLPSVFKKLITDFLSLHINKTPYLRGGKSKEGIDCSGLVQLTYKKVCNVLLPRHSADQMKQGIRIHRKDLGFGDLIFAFSKTGRVRHVAIFGTHSKSSVVHASLEKRLVIKEDLSEFMDRYLIAGARKIVEWKE